MSPMFRMRYRKKGEGLDNMQVVRVQGDGRCGMRQDWVGRMGVLALTRIRLVGRTRWRLLVSIRVLRVHLRRESVVVQYVFGRCRWTKSVWCEQQEVEMV